MPRSRALCPPNELMNFLSQLVLQDGTDVIRAELDERPSDFSRDEFDQLVELASTNHVIVRGLERYLLLMRDIGDDLRVGWAQEALRVEQARITNAVCFLEDICTAFEEEHYEVTIIKSLDHWPDLGSDLDLYTNAVPEGVIRLMRKRFTAEIAPRSWGDRLACKWNFLIPGLPEAVEIHMGRLGQTGEQVGIASQLPERARLAVMGERTFRVPSASDRLMISTLQRMYRHFYFRLCDVVDSAALADAGAIDYSELHATARNAGIWEGVATYLVIVSDYVKKYRDSGLNLPSFVRASARFDGGDVYYGRGFLRIPIMPQSASLYSSQLSELIRRRDLESTARLSLLPWLATAAVVGQKITGSDKGIW
ncbi:MAG: hypothetical protein JOZ33_05350 [Acidobacteriaceae bacterium]|nr:hypothetical protein [Acidobacteriaceae bacterium]